LDDGNVLPALGQNQVLFRNTLVNQPIFYDSRTLERFKRLICLVIPLFPIPGSGQANVVHGKQTARIDQTYDLGNVKCHYWIRVITI